MVLKIKCEQVANNDVIYLFQAFYKILLFKMFLEVNLSSIYHLCCSIHLLFAWMMQSFFKWNYGILNVYLRISFPFLFSGVLKTFGLSQVTFVHSCFYFTPINIFINIFIFISGEFGSQKSGLTYSVQCSSR